MATYATISENWFYRRYPKTLGSFEAFEAEPGIDDRLKSRQVMARMLEEVPLTVSRLYGLDGLPIDLDSLRVLDERITPGEAEWWMKDSDPDDPNNYFKLTVSEFAVFLGTICIGALGASWRYARMPNYFESTIVVEDIEFHVFDTIMKKCSHDFGHEQLSDKFHALATTVAGKRAADSGKPQ
jgi:hypothetical protein